MRIMAPDVQLALHEWLNAIMVDAWGVSETERKGEVNQDHEFEGKTPSQEFLQSQYSVTLGKLLSPRLVLKMLSRSFLLKSYWSMWETLSPRQITKCFQAGAAEFFFPDKPSDQTAEAGSAAL